LDYQLEFSETLGENSWSQTLPPGFLMNAEAYDPDVPGFEMVTSTFPAGTPEKRFVRMNLTLNE
jgi:hypothetical protein